MAYGVVRTDNLHATDVRANGVVSLKYIVSGKEKEIENGCVLKLGGLMDGEREVHSASNVAATDKLSDIVLVASPEVMYDERKKNLDEFINEAGVIVRGYKLHEGDDFGLTIDAISTSLSKISVNNVVELAAGTKLSVVSAASSGSTVVGHIKAIEEAGRYTYYVIHVD